MRFENAMVLYKNIGQYYIYKDEENFTTLIGKNFNEFENDKNWGLVQKLEKMFSKRRICDLNQTYLTLRYK
jgi:hypothetical protein